MKPLEVWTCQRAKNLKKKSSKIPQNNYAATMVSAASRQIIGGGGAPINKSRRRRPQIVGGGSSPCSGFSFSYLSSSTTVLTLQRLTDHLINFVSVSGSPLNTVPLCTVADLLSLSMELCYPINLYKT